MWTKINLLYDLFALVFLHYILFAAQTFFQKSFQRTNICFKNVILKDTIQPLFFLSLHYFSLGYIMHNSLGYMLHSIRPISPGITKWNCIDLLYKLYFSVMNLFHKLFFSTRNLNAHFSIKALFFKQIKSIPMPLILLIDRSMNPCFL